MTNEYIHIYIHTYMHMHRSIHAYISTYIRMYVHTYTRDDINYYYVLQNINAYTYTGAIFRGSNVLGRRVSVF
jgi:hypothetical protein